MNPAQFINFKYFSILSMLKMGLASLAFTFASLPAQAVLSSNPLGDTDFEENQPAEYSPRVLKIDDESDVEYLESIGTKILFRRGDILLTLIPKDIPEDSEDEGAADTYKNIKKGKIHKSRSKFNLHLRDRNFITPAMNEARATCGAQAVLDGDVMGRKFTGKDVIVGFCDIGFDPMHVAFGRPGGEGSRIVKIVQYKEREGQRIELSTPEEYAEWITDTLDNNHATHVAGILAGGYRENGLYGTAPDAEIVATLSQLSSVGLLAGVEEIIAYAKSKGKTPVINLSMGNYSGPHDGTSLFNQYLDRCSEDAIIVLSAGNAGNVPISMQHEFIPEKLSTIGKLNNTKWDNFNMYGITDFWSADQRCFSFTPLIYDEDTRKIVYRMETLNLENFDLWSTCTQQSLAPYFGEPDEELGQYFKGYMEVMGGIDPDNGRYNLQWGYDMQTTPKVSSGGNWARYNLAFEIASETPGTKVYIYADGTYTKLSSYSGGLTANTDGSISDLACGHKVISVGMCNNRSAINYLDGSVKITDRTPGEVSKYSSYGTLIDGRVLPLTVAPGADIISAASLPYIEAHNQGLETLSASATIDGTTHYWVENMGTSMSAPYVAGCIATWLQAAPSLKAEDVQDILRISNSQDYADVTNPRHGGGWLNSQEGIRLALAKNAITRVETDSDSIPVEYIYDNKIFTLINPLLIETAVSIYTPDGRVIDSRILTEDRVYLDFNNYVKGIYIIRLDCSGKSEGIKVVVD